MSDIKITSLELANVKRIKAVTLVPAENGLTVIGGRNGAGKTSVLDAIAWGLGGEKYRPALAKREGSVLDPELRIQLSNGLTVTRKGAKSALTVTDETGKRSGQTLLNDFIETLALDLPKFLGATDKERAGILLDILGIQDQLDELDRKEKAKYDTRLQAGRDRDQAKHYAEGLPWYADAQEAETSVAELTRQLKEAQAVNTKNTILRNRVNNLTVEQQAAEARLRNALRAMESIDKDLRAAKEEAMNLVDVDEDSILQAIQTADEQNGKVRANRARTEADEKAAALEEQYQALNLEIEDIRAQRIALLEGADMPLPELGVENGVLTWAGKPWSCMSSSEQLRSAAAIVSRLKPTCRFVLVDKLEQLDLDTLREFGAWAEAQGLQVIGTRVSTGGECSISSEEGTADGDRQDDPAGEPVQKTWKAGAF